MTGTIQWNVRDLAERRGFRTAYQLALEAKLPMATVKPIWEGTAKGAMLKTMTKLAIALEAKPGDLFQITHLELVP